MIIARRVHEYAFLTRQKHGRRARNRNKFALRMLICILTSLCVTSETSLLNRLPWRWTWAVTWAAGSRGVPPVGLLTLVGVDWMENVERERVVEAKPRLWFEQRQESEKDLEYFLRVLSNRFSALIRNDCWQELLYYFQAFQSRWRAAPRVITDDVCMFEKS